MEARNLFHVIWNFIYIFSVSNVKRKGGNKINYLCYFYFLHYNFAKFSNLFNFAITLYNILFRFILMYRLKFFLLYKRASKNIYWLLNKENPLWLIRKIAKQKSMIYTLSRINAFSKHFAATWWYIALFLSICRCRWM